jgi:hypothetical protein
MGKWGKSSSISLSTQWHMTRWGAIAPPVTRRRSLGSMGSDFGANLSPKYHADKSGHAEGKLGQGTALHPIAHGITHDELGPTLVKSRLFSRFPMDLRVRLFCQRPGAIPRRSSRRSPLGYLDGLGGFALRRRSGLSSRSQRPAA